MIAARPKSRRSHRRAYMLIELVVASFLAIELGMVLVLTWKAFGVSALQVEECEADGECEPGCRVVHPGLGRISGQVRSFAPNDSTNVDRLYQFNSRLPLRLRSSVSPAVALSGCGPDLDNDHDQLQLRPYHEQPDSGRRDRRDVHHGRDPRHESGSGPILPGETSFNINFTVSYRDFTGKYTLNMQYPQ